MRSRFDTQVAAPNISSRELPVSNLWTHVTALLGLYIHHPFHRDSVFLLLFALGPLVWLAMIWCFAFHPLPWQAIWSAAFASIALWHPLFEELLFRGVIQGQFLQTLWGRKTWVGLSASNLVVSLLFTFFHLASHSISWSLLVFAPSLCFGFARDRFGSVYPAIVLHVFYNAGYFLLIGGATLPNSR